VLLEYLQIGFVAFVIVFGFIRPFIIEPYKIPSGSMEDTLLVGDRVLVIKFLYGVKLPGTARRLFAFSRPKRGDVFVFSPKHDPRTHFIKRVVALEGDTLETRGKTLIVNGQPLLNETYVKHLPSSLPDFPPFQYPLVPYFFEAPGVAETIQNYTTREAVENVQVRDGMPAAFTLEGHGQYLVRYIREHQKSLAPQEHGVREFFLVDAETEQGELLLRVILYQNIATGQWYLTERMSREDYLTKHPEGDPFVVPENHFFGMGDNRENSADARAWGPIPFDVVKGKAVLVYWSTDGDAPAFDLLKRVRWNRIGRLIRSQYGQ
jgi:signal peptidase I